MKRNLLGDSIERIEESIEDFILDCMEDLEKEECQVAGEIYNIDYPDFDQTVYNVEYKLISISSNFVEVEVLNIN